VVDLQSAARLPPDPWHPKMFATVSTLRRRAGARAIGRGLILNHGIDGDAVSPAPRP
jgi:hypothetical protein